MFHKIKHGLQMIFKSRLIVAGVVMTAIFSVLLWRVFSLQIINGSEYQNNYTLKIIKERTINSARGNIYDRNGNLLAYNELAYSVTIEDNGNYSSTKEKNKALNAEIAQIVAALESNGDTITNDFKISMNDDGSYEFNVTGASWKRFLADVFGKASYDELSYDEKLDYDRANATAQQVMDYLAGEKRFNVGEEYSQEMVYKIVLIRYAISENSYQKYIATTIATDVSDRSVAYITEHSSQLQGVEVIDDTVRRYNNSEYFASIIGYTGKISVDEYNDLTKKDDRYSLNDVIGKAGIEQYMDSELQGNKGFEKLYVDYLGKVIEIIDSEDATAGNDVYLSLDMDLQIATYDLLEQEIAGIVYTNIENSSSDINIPITDVYFALINNNIIDTDNFTDEEASFHEQEVAQIFQKRQQEVLSELREELTGSAVTNFAEMSTENQDYYTHIINLLKTNQILNTDAIDTSDEIYQKWQKGTIGPKEYLNHAIAEGWIDITKFVIEEKYSDSAEIYQALCTYILDSISDDRDFSKIIYNYLVHSGAISGRQLCLILIDQGVLVYDIDEVHALENGTVSAQSFLKDKIKNLDITPAQLALDPCTGSCVITDTKTGEVLAMVSYPGYDNNRMANTVDADYFESLRTDLAAPLFNYATQQRTAPGSTFKMVTSTAGLSEGVITTTEQIQDLGVYMNVDNEPKCWIYPSNHGRINVSQAIRDSCNYYFYEVGFRLSTNNYATTYNDTLGISKIHEYASLYGFDETTGVEIEEYTPQIADEYPVMASIGQSNNNYTTVQLARYVTAVANSGTVYQYTLIDRVEDSDGTIIKEYHPSIRNKVDVLDANEWDAIHSGMRMVVQNLETFSDFPIAVAGKTGTAQQTPTRANHALFVCYAPFDNPEISVATRIAYGYTSHNAADVTKDILSYYFKVEDKEELLSGQAADVNSSSNQFSD